MEERSGYRWRGDENAIWTGSRFVDRRGRFICNYDLQKPTVSENWHNTERRWDLFKELLQEDLSRKIGNEDYVPQGRIREKLIRLGLYSEDLGWTGEGSIMGIFLLQPRNFWREVVRSNANERFGRPPLRCSLCGSDKQLVVPLMDFDGYLCMADHGPVEVFSAEAPIELRTVEWYGKRVAIWTGAQWIDKWGGFICNYNLQSPPNYDEGRDEYWKIYKGLSDTMIECLLGMNDSPRKSTLDALVNRGVYTKGAQGITKMGWALFFRLHAELTSNGVSPWQAYLSK